MYEYLSLLPKNLDDQQYAACCAEGNTIVAAGAGSGKTQVLATRFVWLVMSKKIPVEKILTLTFTNKAAAEMYVRIYQTLVFFAQNPDVPLEERERARRAVDDFSNSHIQTLDSYCASIVRQAANRYGIRPNFTIGSSDSLRIIKDLALPFTLKYRNDQALVSFTKPGKFQDTAEKLFAQTISKYTSVADKNGFFSDKIAVQKELITSEWNKVFQPTESFYQCVNEIIEEYENAAPEKKASPYFENLYKVFPLNKFSFEELLKNIPSAPRLDDKSFENENTVKSVENFCKWLSKIDFNQRTKGYTKPLQSTIKRLREILNDKIRPLASYITQYENIKRLYELLDVFLCEVNNSKRGSGKLSFRDVGELALKILNEQEDIRSAEQNSYDMIMIDEFQDNNGKNRDLLFLLADGKDKLFFVGDEKQSIYKFRGADVSVFNELERDLSLEPLQMVYNYRSSSELLKAFNQIFGGYVEDDKTGNFTKISEILNALSAPSSDAAGKSEIWVFPEVPEHTFEASFTKKNIALKNYKADSSRAGYAGSESDGQAKLQAPVHFCMYNTNTEKYLSGLKASNLISGAETAEEAFLTAKDQCAYFIAQKISELTSQKGADGKPVKFGDIAVLDRTRKDRSYLTRYLNRRGIPYTLDFHNSLFSEAPVNDIYNFLRLCIYPSDMRSFAAFLRSPFAGLSETSVETILSCLTEDKDEKISSLLSQAEFEKYCKAKDIQREFAKFAVSHPITQTVSKLWYGYGYRFETLWNKTVATYSGQYDLLFELARRTDNDGKSLAWFVDNLALKKFQEISFLGDDSDLDSGEIDFPTEDIDAVKIMTIHKSKGLQFPFVFIYGCTEDPVTHGSTEKVFYSEKYGVTPSVNGSSENYFYKIQSEQAALQDIAEFKRLLYVGFTRAKEEVYVTGSWQRPKPARSASKDSIIEKIISYYYPDIAEDPESVLGKTVYNEKSVVKPTFDFTSIKPIHRLALLKSSDTGIKNTAAAKQNFINEAEDFYANAKLVKKEDVPLRYLSPSSLEISEEELIKTHPQASAIQPEKIFYEELNDLINKLKDKGFGFNDFGTLAHAYLEAYANGIAPENFTPQAATAFHEARGISKTDIQKIRNICVQMTKQFEISNAGKLLKQSIMHKAEFKFLHNSGGKIVRGTIDLILKTSDTNIYIIDYKTDERIVCEKYLAQQECYRKAAAEIFDTKENKIRCILFYLRYGKEIDITEML
ncbi:UvrD-helicase domain-containing protein [Treponema parvum]|uniref:UvrD-helicase domain-containing protein n=1 Tax=Treponema parvum TaxID=138851 RepID=UPI001AEBE628|nr:UvrD-helicase domain-containing protein [Treponema parvum]QTQ16115.1 UvrD-helicase domain-containing protein [Treponema parvum]